MDNGENTVSSVSAARVNGKLHTKNNEIRIVSNTIHKSKLKLGLKPTCKTTYYKILIGK